MNPKTQTAPSVLSYDVERLRKDFPILSQEVHGHPLVYLDNAATSHKPLSVIEATDKFYREDNSNIHRGVHLLSERATQAYEAARARTQAFLKAASPNEIIFTRGATEGVNLVAQTWGRQNIGAGDEIILSALEHHSNIVPWQMLAEEKGARIRVIPIDDAGDLLMEEYQKLLNPNTKLVAITQVSNALGTITPMTDIIRLAHAKGALVLVDGAQGIPHLAVDVKALDCDFYVFSAHKLYGPTGVGVLYGKLKLLNSMPPYQGGGDMISTVTFEKTTYKKAPYKFEAGTPNIAGGVALTAALDYVDSIGISAIAAHEHELLVYGTEKLSKIPGLRLIGTARQKAGVISFTLGDIHPHDIGTILDRQGVAIRAGHHCAQPVMDRFSIPATARASFGLYNTKAEVDALEAGIRKVLEVFG